MTQVPADVLLKVAVDIICDSRRPREVPDTQKVPAALRPYIKPAEGKE